MALKEIKEKIIAEAKEEADKIIEEANKKAQEIREKTEKEIENTRSKILNQSQQEISLKRGKIVTEANLEARKNILSTKQEMVDKAFNQALEKVTKLDLESYLNFIKKIILSNIERGNETTFVGAVDKDRVTPSFIEEINEELRIKGKRGELTLSPTYLEIKGGVIIGTDNIRKNSSLELMFRKAREELEVEISQYLFA